MIYDNTLIKARLSCVAIGTDKKLPACSYKRFLKGTNYSKYCNLDSFGIYIVC